MGQNRIQESDDALKQVKLQHQDVGKEFYADLKKSKGVEKKHKCTYSGCDSSFHRRDRLERHIRSIHTGERPYKCSYPECNKAYTNSMYLKRHVESHSLTKKVYKCPECSLSLTYRHNLKRHYDRVHVKNSKLACKDCNLTFAKKYQLATHLAMEHKTTIKCDKCNKAFTERAKFKKHVTIHQEGKRQYTCTAPECKEVFYKWRLLCAHRKTQHQTCYICKTCDKVFLYKNHLKAHFKLHMENRPVIPCPYENCPRMYYFKRNLDYHIRIYHLGQKYECDICKVKISSKKRLAEHIQKIHTSERVVRKVKKLNRAKRKDAGIPRSRRSVISTLIGVILPHNV